MPTVSDSSPSPKFPLCSAVKKALLAECGIGTLILLGFIVHQIVCGRYAMTVFMAAAGALFLPITLTLLIRNRKNLCPRTLLPSLAVPVAILALYMLIGAVCGALV